MYLQRKNTYFIRKTNRRVSRKSLKTTSWLTGKEFASQPYDFDFRSTGWNFAQVPSPIAPAKTNIFREDLVEGKREKLEFPATNHQAVARF